MWTDAFIIDIDLYCKAHPDTYTELLKYMHTIRLGAKRSSLGRKSYDEQFRLRHVSYLSSSCAVIDAELWLLYIHSEGVMSQGQIAVSKINKCYAINYNGHCQKSVCHYSHTCWRCCGSHSVKFCNLRSSTLGSQGFEKMLIFVF